MIITFGGSFNPPTVGHEEIARKMIEVYECEQLQFIPVGDHYEKKGLINSNHRVEMLELVCRGLDKASVNLVEVNQQRALTTYETLRIIESEYPGQEIRFVMGADNLEQLPKWENGMKLIENFKVIVLNRMYINVEKIIERCFSHLKEQFYILNVDGIQSVSSTQYRNYLENNHIVNPMIDQYCREQQLYGRK